MRTTGILAHALTLVGFAWSAVGVAAAELEFAGFMDTRDGRRFVVTDLTEPKSSEFLALGRAFRGYTLKDFDAGRAVLVVERDGLRKELALKDAAVKNGSGEKSGRVELTLMVSPDGSRFDADGVPVSLAQLEAAARSTERKQKMHVWLVVPRARTDGEGQAVTEAMRAMLKTLAPVWPKGSSLELVRVDPELATPSKK